MKYIDLINESVQKMANKPSEGAIFAAQSIARVIDDALVNKYKIEWKCLPIQGSETVDIINVGSKFGFVCRMYDKDTWNQVSEIICAVGDETSVNQMEVFLDLMNRISQVFE